MPAIQISREERGNGKEMKFGETLIFFVKQKGTLKNKPTLIVFSHEQRKAEEHT